MSPEPLHATGATSAPSGAQPRGQEARDPNSWDAELASQTREEHVKRNLFLAGEQLQGGARKNFERHHGGRRVPRQAEEGSLARAAEDQRLAGLDEHAVEKELGAQAGEHWLDDVVFARGDAAGEQQQVGGEAPLDDFGVWTGLLRVTRKVCGVPPARATCAARE